MIPTLMALAIELLSPQAQACKCSPVILQKLLKQPEKARIAALIRIEPGQRMRALPWSSATPAPLENQGTSCDLRIKEGEWHLLLSDAGPGERPIQCDSVVKPFAESTEIIERLSRARPKNHPSPDPGWSIGCNTDQDCTLIPKGQCTGSVAVLGKNRVKATAWRKLAKPQPQCAPPLGVSDHEKSSCISGICTTTEPPPP